MKDRFWPNEPGIFDRLDQSSRAKGNRIADIAKSLLTDQTGHVLVGHFPSVEPLGHLAHDHHRGIVKIASLAGTAGLTVLMAVSMEKPAVEAQTIVSPDNSQANTLQIDNHAGAAVVVTTDDSLWRVTDQRNSSSDPKPPENEVKTVVPSINNGQNPEEKPNTEGPNEPVDVVSGGGSADQESTVIREYPQKNPDGSVVLVKEWTNGEFTTEILEAAPAPPKIVKEVARTFPEERPDGSVWLVVQYSDGSFGRDMISGPTKQAQSPVQLPAPPASPPSLVTSPPVEQDVDCPVPRGVVNDRFPTNSVSGGEGVKKVGKYIGHQGPVVMADEKKMVLTIEGKPIEFYVLSREAVKDQQFLRRNNAKEGVGYRSTVLFYKIGSKTYGPVEYNKCAFKHGDAVNVQVHENHTGNRFEGIGPNIDAVWVWRDPE